MINGDLKDLKELGNSELLELILDCRIEYNRRTLVHGDPLPYKHRFDQVEWNKMCSTMKAKFVGREPETLHEKESAGDRKSQSPI